MEEATPCNRCLGRCPGRPALCTAGQTPAPDRHTRVRVVASAFRRGLRRRDHSTTGSEAAYMASVSSPIANLPCSPPVKAQHKKIGLQMGNANPNATRAGSSTGERFALSAGWRRNWFGRRHALIPPIRRSEPLEVGAEGRGIGALPRLNRRSRRIFLERSGTGP